MKSPLVFTIILLIALFSDAQNTVGLISYDPAVSSEGYNLIYPNGQSATYLINNCGELINKWDGEETARPGMSTYLLPNGNLIRCNRPSSTFGSSINGGGAGGKVEILDWQSNVIWEFFHVNDTVRLHHDIQSMPNGNILMISWELKNEQEMLQAGRNPAATNTALWPDYILEVNPDTDAIVWEWHAWNHLIQDFDASKDNFGIVENHPELIDINFSENPDAPDWMHINSIDYHPELDQILLSVAHFNEIWIIDHSTTTAEAASGEGGLSGKGGDLLFRWGNPVTYKNGGTTDQKLFFQHDAQWIDDFVDQSHPHFNKIALFNNKAGDDFSTGEVLNPVFNESTWSYGMMNNKFLPTNFDLTITHPNPNQLYSSSVSSIQLLDNQNFLFLSGREGYAVEITPDNEVIWEYEIPIINGQTATQGQVPATNQNFTFRIERYPLTYSAFDNQDIFPQGYFELEPDTNFCNILLPTNQVLSDFSIKVFPNPAIEFIRFDKADNEPITIKIFNIYGQLMEDFEMEYSVNVDVKSWSSGIYLIFVNDQYFQNVIKESMKY